MALPAGRAIIGYGTMAADPPETCNYGWSCTPCGDQAGRVIFLAAARRRPGGKEFLCQAEWSEAREMHEWFINLSAKGKRSGKFFWRLFAFPGIAAAAPGTAY